MTTSPTGRRPKAPSRRRPPKVDTERALAMRACARHLKDLQRAQGEPPANVAVKECRVPNFIPPIIEQSYCTSPAALCVELAEGEYRALPVGPVELAQLADLGAELIELDAQLAEFVK